MKCPCCGNPYSQRRNRWIYFCGRCKILFDIERGYKKEEVIEPYQVRTWNPSSRYSK